MLSTPEHGWSTITLGDWSDRCSYIDDVPMILLDTFVKTYETNGLQAIEFDAEGWEYVIVLGKYGAIVVEVDGDMSQAEDDDAVHDDSPVAYRIDTKIGDLAKELVADIRRDIDGWTEWLSYADYPRDTLNKRKAVLLSLCDQLEQHIRRGK